MTSINGLTGREDCSEAVLVSHQPAWMRSGLAFLLVFVLAGVFGFFTSDLGGWLGTLVLLLFAVAVGVGFALLIDYYVIARAGDEIVLAEKSPWTNKLVGIAHQYHPPLAADVTKKWLQVHAEVDGRVLTMNKKHVGRFEKIVG